jgi:hypothetical protein
MSEMEILQLTEGNMLIAFGKGLGGWRLHRTPITTYKFSHFNEEIQYNKNNPEDFYATKKSTKEENIGHHLFDLWFGKWIELGCKKEGVPREIKLMVWMLDPISKIPTPYPIVTCEELVLWDISSREALEASGIKDQKSIKGLWCYESEPLAFSITTINYIIKNTERARKEFGTKEWYRTELDKPILF